ncbi:MAG: hypothetical protein KW788_02715 [Candidatus Doudnabacteria bacterium]|nr:hypothetical protein [Candidatus Doudnabacteria bacterium]
MAKNNPINPEADRVEYRQVRRDLIFVIIMNIIFFGLLLGLYFYNRSSGGQVDLFFSRLLKF